MPSHILLVLLLCSSSYAQHNQGTLDPGGDYSSDIDSTNRSMSPRPLQVQGSGKTLGTINAPKGSLGPQSLDQGAAINSSGKGGPTGYQRVKGDLSNTNAADTCPDKFTVTGAGNGAVATWKTGRRSQGNLSVGDPNETAQFKNRNSPEIGMTDLYPNRTIFQFNVTKDDPPNGQRTLSIAERGAVSPAYYNVKPEDFGRGLEQQSTKLWAVKNADGSYCLIGGGK
jgi:hypothetical protein